MKHQPATEREWTNGLFSCFNHIPSCIGSCFCPCLQYGLNTGSLTGDDQVGDICYNSCYYLVSDLCGCHSCVGGELRTDIRKAYGIQGDGCGDCLIHCCCYPCALAQEAQEIAHVKKQNAASAYPPVVAMMTPQQYQAPPPQMMYQQQGPQASQQTVYQQ